MTNKELGHRPVLIEEVIEQLGPKDNEPYIDATFGYGGYTERILQSCECKVIAIDRDPTVKKQAERFKKKYVLIYNNQFKWKCYCRMFI